MNIYLTIMVTVLVATQVIRITQNAIQLRRQERAIAKDLAWIKDNGVTQRDFEVQRDCFYMLREYLGKEMNINWGAEDYYEGSEDG